MNDKLFRKLIIEWLSVLWIMSLLVSFISATMGGNWNAVLFIFLLPAIIILALIILTALNALIYRVFRGG